MQRSGLRGKPALKIGIVNNMPDAALLATERQFLRLLEPASRDFDIHIGFYYLPEIARGEAARMQMRGRYEPAGALPGAGVDALLVTGCEPLEPDMRREVYWPSLARLIDWAKDNTISTIWSCLAAHAAVLHLDGIKRRKLPRKLSGVYEFAHASDHRLQGDLPNPIHIPHSRLNGLLQQDLIESGYEILTASAAAGVDAFAKSYASLFVFLQGHPEYEADSLYREYRRDMLRFLKDERDTCPPVPENYFDPASLRRLEAFVEQAKATRKPEVIERFPSFEELRSSAPEWHAFSARLFANWIAYIAQAKMRASRAARAHAPV
jgi:homoserine O-succinyltransferase/O-acetyltransferase